MPKHEEIRYLNFSSEKLFDLVADIERYPEFLPWCLDAKIIKKEDIWSFEKSIKSKDPNWLLGST